MRVRMSQEVSSGAQHASLATRDESGAILEARAPHVWSREREITWWLRLIARDICWQHCISLHVKFPLWGRQGRTWRLGEEEKGAADVADGRNNDEECFRADRCVCKTERERERKEACKVVS